MARTKGSKDTKKRQAKKDAYQTYSYWYDRYTTGDKKGWFRQKYTKAEFETEYKKAKAAKLANPARAVAQSQEYVDRKFEKQYKKFYGTDLPDIRDKVIRENIFTQFTDDLMAQGYTFKEAKHEFEEYFY